jgi:very-short-patch-repair endonuclease
MPTNKPTRQTAARRAESPLEASIAVQMRAAEIAAPEREYRFAPPRRWKFDFAWPDRFIALEVEGGTFAGGRHTRGKGFEADCEKYNAAAIAGWTVLRVTAAMIRDGRALAIAETALRERQGLEHMLRARIEQMDPRTASALDTLMRAAADEIQGKGSPS